MIFVIQNLLNTIINLWTYYFVQERSYSAKAVKSDSKFPMIDNFAPYPLRQKVKIQYIGGT